MTVDDRLHVGPRLVDLAMDEALEEQRLSPGVDGDAVEVVFEMSSAFTRAGAMLRDIR